MKARKGEFPIFEVTQTKPPFVEYATAQDDIVIRMFDSAYPESLYQWHKDDESRNIEVLELGDDWHFQFDNKIPNKLEKGQTFRIEKDVWHRLIKGKNKLVLSIQKLG